jgi:hypothetical protein
MLLFIKTIAFESYVTSMVYYSSSYQLCATISLGLALDFEKFDDFLQFVISQSSANNVRGHFKNAGYVVKMHVFVYN